MGCAVKGNSTEQGREVETDERWWGGVSGWSGRKVINIGVEATRSGGLWKHLAVDVRRDAG